MIQIMLLTLIAVCVLAAISIMVLAFCEIINGMRDRRNDANAQPVVVYQQAPVEPAKEVEKEAVALEPAVTAVEEAVVEEPAEDDGKVTFQSEKEMRKTLKQAYAELNQTNKDLYDKLINEVVSLEKIRCKESLYAYTAMQGQATIAKIKIARGTIVLDCTIVNADLKNYAKETGKKIKPKPMRFKITDEDELSSAVFTLKVANQEALEARNLKK